MRLGHLRRQAQQQQVLHLQRAQHQQRAGEEEGQLLCRYVPTLVRLCVDVANAVEVDGMSKVCVCVCAESGQPICGNGLVETGEQCDCGYSDQCKDQCCYDANEADGKKCKLKPGQICRSVLKLY